MHHILHKASRLAAAGAIAVAAAASAPAAVINEPSLIWSLQYEQAHLAESVTTTQIQFERDFDSPAGQDLRGRADLSTGQVGTRVDSLAGNSGQAMVVMFDTLSFTLAGPDAVTVAYTARYEGQLFKPDQFAQAYAVHQVSIYDITGLGPWIESRSFAGLFDTFAPVPQASLVAETVLDNRIAVDGVQLVDVNGAGSFQVLPGHTYGIRIVSNTFASGGAYADFDGTGTFRFTDLAGARFESGSGAFLSAVTSPVPEPPTVLMLLMGMAVWLLRQSRRLLPRGCRPGHHLVAAAWASSFAVGAAAQATITDDDVERLFNWAEASYPQQFPGPGTTLTDGPYRYRHYPATGNYVGAAGIDVYVLGPIAGGALLKVGELGDFRCRVRPADCTAPHATRAFSRQRSMLLEHDGRVVTVADVIPVAGAESIAGSAASRLPVRGRKVVMTETGGLALASDGSVTMWGAGYDAAQGGSLLARMVWPEKLIDVSDRGYGLSAEGVMIIPTAFETVGDEQRVKHSLSIPLDQPVRQFGPGTYVIFKDGTVAKVTVPLPVGRIAVEPVVGATDVRSMACGGSRCLALRTDGRVLAWGYGPLGDGNDRVHSSGHVAVPVQGLSSVRDVAVMSLGKTSATSVALRDDGQLWIWGHRDDTGVAIPYPERWAALDSVTDLACSFHCVVRRSDGSIWGWGLNQQNELGNFGPAVTYQREPVQARGLILP